MNGLSLRQLNEIRRGLDSGLSPDEISDSIGRIGDLSVLDVRLVGGRADGHTVIEKNLDPRYVQRAAVSLPAPPAVGAPVVLCDHGGRIRRAEVVEVDGPLFEATYALKSGQWRSGWFDVAALQLSEAGSG